MEKDGTITVKDLAENSRAYIIARREYLAKDVGDLLKTPTVIIRAKDYLSMIPSNISPEIPVVGFRIRNSYVMWTKFPIKPNLYWSYFFGLALGSKSGKVGDIIKLTIEPNIMRYLKKEVLKKLKIVYGIEVRKLGMVRLIIPTSCAFILHKWGIDKDEIPPFLNKHKVIEGYLNSNALKVRHPEKSEAEIYGKITLLEQISNYLNAIEIPSILKERTTLAKGNVLRITGRKNVVGLLKKFIIIHPINVSRLMFLQEITHKKYLSYALKYIPLKYRDILYFIAWKNKISFGTIVKYLHLPEHYVAKGLDLLKKIRLIEISPGHFGLHITYTPDHFKGIVFSEVTDKLHGIEEILSSHALEFYVCDKCGRYYSFDKASEIEFTCCGKPLKHQKLTTKTFRVLKILRKKYQTFLKNL